MNEYSSLKDGPLYSWGELNPGSLLLRLGGLWLVTFTVLGVPIAAASFNPPQVKADDDLAAAAAEAADGRPVYCRDRLYRALAGGQYFLNKFLAPTENSEQISFNDTPHC